MGTGKTYSTKYLLDSNNSSGVAGQVLSTTSTGIDWVDANTVPGAGLWLANGNDIYNSNSGNVGIGQVTPLNSLDIYRATGDASIRIQANTAADSTILKFRNNNADADITVDYTTSNKARMVFTTDNSGGYVPVLSLEANRDTLMYGNVGIGTTNPSAKLSVDGVASMGSNSRLSMGILDINSGATPTQILIQTTIPWNSGSADFTVNIKGFVYGTDESCNLSIHWHYYNNVPYNANITSSGSWAPIAKLHSSDATTPANGFVQIHLLSPGYWPKIYVESMYSSAYNDLYASGWSWSDAAGTGTAYALDYNKDFGNNFVMTDPGNVGIGTASPSTQLEIASNTAAGALKITQSAEVTGNAMVYIDNNSASNKPALRIDVTAGGNATDTHGVLINNSGPGYGLIVTGGNVGIGTTSPDSKLSVTSTTLNSEDILYLKSGADNVNDYLGIAWELGVGGNGPHSAIRSFAGPSGSDARLGFLTTSDGGTTLTEGLSVAHNSNVGIGVTSPTAKLHVAGSTRVTGDLYFDTTSTALYKIKKDGTSLQIWGNATVPAIEVLDTGVLKLGTYALSGLGTPTHLLGVTSTGQVVKTTSGSDLPGGPYLPLSAGSSYPLTGDLYIDEDSLYLLNASNNYWRVQNNSSGKLVFKQGTTQRGIWSSGELQLANNLIVDSNVGIGVTNPGVKLQVLSASEQLTNFSSSVADQLAYSQINASSSTTGTITAAAALELVGQANASGHGRHAWIGAEGTPNTTFETKLKFKIRGAAGGYDWSGSAEAPTIMTLEGTGNVGIGTASPNDLLEIEGDADVYARVHYTGNGSNSPADVCGIKLEHGRATWNIRNTYNGGVSYPDGAFSINSGTKANALTILNNTSSDIGIGTNAPTAKLHVNGSDFLVSNGGEEAINVDLDNYVYKFGDISGGENQSYFGISSANAQAYFLNCDVGIGTSSPNVPLDVTVSDTGSSFNDGAVQLSNTTSASSGGATVMNIRNNYGGGFGTLIKFFRTSTSSSIANISFNSGGTAVNYNTGSDYRLKEDLQTFNGLDILSNISVYNYKWKGVDFRGYGVIAHELQPIFPDAVTGEKDAEEMQSVDYSKLVPVLIKSVQELKKEIELLKQQLNK